MYAAELPSTDQPETRDRNGPVGKSVEGSTATGPTLPAGLAAERDRAAALAGGAPGADVVLVDGAVEGVGLAVVERVAGGLVVVVDDPGDVVACCAPVVAPVPATAAGTVASVGRVASTTAPTRASAPAPATSAVRRVLVLSSGLLGVTVTG